MCKTIFYSGKEPFDNINSEDKVLCQICQKDLNHMNSVRRTQHVNRCIDEVIKVLNRKNFNYAVLLFHVQAVNECLSPMFYCVSSMSKS